jgi:S-(hydroxymethyl)glutathione dehydrogenase/alcohol dehydrogenase
MKAAVLWERGGPLAIEEVELDPPGPHEVRVRVAAAGVCRTDLSYLTKAPDTALPMVFGHESAGVVEEIGREVDYVQPGDHVITYGATFCGKCVPCLTGLSHLCRGQGDVRSSGARRITMGSHKLSTLGNMGSFAEAVLVAENGLLKIDPSIRLDVAALLGCGVPTGMGAVFNTAKVAAGQTVAVIGCGGVGLSAVQAARIAGARRIVAIDPVPGRLEVARRFGATDVVDASREDPVSAVRDLTDGGVDHAFEVVGRADTVAQAVAMTGLRGTTTCVGSITGLTLQIDGTDLALSEKRVQACLMGSNRPRVDVPRYLELYRQGRLFLDEMVTDHVPLEKINDVLAGMVAGEGVRSVVAFDVEGVGGAGDGR